MNNFQRMWKEFDEKMEEIRESGKYIGKVLTGMYSHLHRSNVKGTSQELRKLEKEWNGKCSVYLELPNFEKGWMSFNPIYLQSHFVISDSKEYQENLSQRNKNGNFGMFMSEVI